MTKQKIKLCVGLPRSGKSTWAREQGLPIVSADAVRLAMHGKRFDKAFEPAVWTFVYMMADALFRAGCPEIIVDETSVTKERRDKWRQKFPDAEVEIKVFDTPIHVCLQRAIDTKQEDLIPVIYRMAEEWDLPWNWDGLGAGMEV